MSIFKSIKNPQLGINREIAEITAISRLTRLEQKINSLLSFLDLSFLYYGLRSPIRVQTTGDNELTIQEIKLLGLRNSSNNWTVLPLSTTSVAVTGTSIRKYIYAYENAGNLKIEVSVDPPSSDKLYKNGNEKYAFISTCYLGQEGIICAYNQVDNKYRAINFIWDPPGGGFASPQRIAFVSSVTNISFQTTPNANFVPSIAKLYSLRVRIRAVATPNSGASGLANFLLNYKGLLRDSEYDAIPFALYCPNDTALTENCFEFEVPYYDTIAYKMDVNTNILGSMWISVGGFIL